MPIFGFRFVFLCLAFPLLAPAQKLDQHDLVLFTLGQTAEGLWTLGSPQFLTDFNRSGYNNQPAFMPGSELYLAAQLSPDTSQTEIIALHPGNRVRTRITATPDYSEFSPQLMPDGKQFSVVRMDRQGVQHLWAYPLDRSHGGRPLFPAVGNVGYQCWLKDTLAALFLVGDPHILVIVGIKGQKPMRIASDPGRCMQRAADGKLIYVQKATALTWFLKSYDPVQQSSEIITETLPGSEDFAILPDGSYLSGNGPKLYRLNPDRSDKWVEFADLGKYGIHSITRLAISREGKVALVVD